jgi:adenosylhomocysteine nucleosidase
MNPIIIQGATNSEINILKNKLINPEEIIIGDFEFTKGKFENVDVVISRTKVGEINASAATAIGILNFSPRAIINQGTAGGHSKEVHKGDLVIGEEYIQINSYKSEYLEENQGINVNHWNIREFNSDEYKNIDTHRFANSKLVDLAKKELPKLTNSTVHAGVIGSGDVWNNEADRIIFLNKEYKTLCEEMEVAGVYKIANSFNVPVLSVRIISNNEILKEEYEPQIAEKSQKIIYEFIKKI